MKKQLLLATLLISGLATAQSFTQSNEPSIGEQSGYFLCDSNAVNYSNITGSGVTWDYSAISGIFGVTKSIEVTDATESSFYSHFDGATKAITVGGSVTTFFNSTSGSRVSQGFVYVEPSFGDVIAKWTNDPEILYNYPMSVTNGLTDVFSGNLLFELNGIPQNNACYGNIVAEADGTGEILLPGGISYDVIRYKMIDSAFTTVILLGSVQVIRTQYEYYDHSFSNLPVFIHTNIKIQPTSSSTPLTEQSLVLSFVEPQTWVGLNELQSEKISVYPNPANESIRINGIEKGTAEVRILDQSGRIVSTVSNVSNGQKIDLSGIGSGIYLFEITTLNGRSIERVSIR